jgi:hypothetical protein
MPMAPDDLAIFMEHLNRFGHPEPCPICRSRKWGVDGPVAAMMITKAPEGGMEVLANEGLPVVFAHCVKCGFLRQFVWYPIKSGAYRDG